MTNYTKPNFASSAVITIDTQCDTLDGKPLEIPGTSAVVPKIRRILDLYRKKKMPIIHIVRIYKKDGSNADLCRRQAIENGTKILLEGSSGCELASDMFREKKIKLDADLLLSGKIQEISDYEVIIYKPMWGAFYNTPLESYLKVLGVDTLIFLGCNFPNCPRTAIYEASERDFRIILVEDAVSGLYSKGKMEMLNIGVNVLTTQTIEDAINAL
jgi:nicotinamidase-related amidase